MTNGSLIRLSARTDRRGGELIYPVVRGYDDPKGEKLLTFFVHGFNNAESTALDRWDDEVWRGIRHWTKAPVGTVVLFFWPGDTDTLKAISGSLYPRKVQVAIDAGTELGKYIKDIAGQNKGLEVRFVGHSLGCRVVLSAVRELAREPAVVPVVGTLLMGAAVPEGDCSGSGQWHRRISEAFSAMADESREPSKEIVLYSPDDAILNKVFATGEKLARLSGVRSEKPYEAVGLKGNPTERWDERKLCAVKHDKYLTDLKALRYVAELFGPLTHRPLDESLPGERNVMESHLDERSLESVSDRIRG